VSVASTRRYRLRRAIERGDPRLGLVVGLVLSLLWAAVSSAGFFEPLELRALDFAFQHRSPIRESDKIVLIDFDDQSVREYGWPLRREYYGQAIQALDRLGARQIVFDIQFRTIIARPRDFDEKTGEYLLEPGDKAFRSAIVRSGKVTLAYGFDLEGSLSAEIANAQEQAFVTQVAEQMDRKAGMTFPELRERFLPNYDFRTQQRELRLLQYAYWNQRCRSLIDDKSLWSF
jgi:CHASE2 domain-containing sensor protein